ncbi:MAG: uracil-xanthine permease [Lachnospiraceae bacterium]|nr:uracil-xanthine permease [Lachnospiraceae bacterium]
MKLIYQVEDKPKFSQLIVFAIQQLLAIMTATLVVPVIINGNVADAIKKGDIAWEMTKTMSPAAALFGAGVGTLIYLFFTMRKSPVFLGSSFAFLGSMTSAFAGASTMALGYLGLILGAVIAGLVYVIIAIVVKFRGTKWIEKLMPAVVIGPTVAIIGLSLAGNAVGDLTTAIAEDAEKGTPATDPKIALLCGLVTLGVVMFSSVYGKKSGKLIPFIYGILAGYFFALIVSHCGYMLKIPEMYIISENAWDGFLVDGKIAFKSFINMPDLTFLNAKGAFSDFNGTYFLTILVAYAPVAFVVFAEHIADHMNISSIIERDLLKDPGLDKTLLGDGVGSMVGAFFGGCPNTTYGESIGCVAITKNASVVSIFAAAIGAIVISFCNPFIVFVNSIPSCVMGGVCMALYGFIAVSGLKMIQKVDLNDNRNLFVVSVILIAGVGGLAVTFTTANGVITITEVACALILGILTNLMMKPAAKQAEAKEEAPKEREKE